MLEMPYLTYIVTVYTYNVKFILLIIKFIQVILYRSYSLISYPGVISARPAQSTMCTCTMPPNWIYDHSPMISSVSYFSNVVTVKS